MLSVFKKKIRSFFKDSETIFLARAQVLAGSVVTVVAMTEPEILAPLIPVKWFGPYLLVAGVVIELARRARATDLKG